jgi:FAD/FMN-containing dehydrogenase
VLGLLALARDLTGDGVFAFEMISRFALELVLRHIPGTSDPLAAPAPWYVLTDLTVARQVAEAFLAAAFERGLIEDAVLAGSAAQAKALWKLRESISESQKHEGGSIKHDISVPVSRIPAFMREALAAAERLIPGIRPVPFGHVGDGNLHFNFTQPVGMDKEAYLAKWEALNRVVHDIVIAHGGSISAEHGIGVLKREEARRRKSAGRAGSRTALRRIKQARTLDPKGIMNPGNRGRTSPNGGVSNSRCATASAGQRWRWIWPCSSTGNSMSPIGCTPSTISSMRSTARASTAKAAPTCRWPSIRADFFPRRNNRWSMRRFA